MKNRARFKHIREYLKISEAADFLGVSPDTLRNWDRGGKLTAYRNPINSYRLYAVKELEQLLRTVAVKKSGTKTGGEGEQ